MYNYIMSIINKKKEFNAKEEAAFIAYIALYFNCDKETCRKIIGNTTTVYNKISKRITRVTPFFSASPLKKME